MKPLLLSTRSLTVGPALALAAVGLFCGAADAMKIAIPGISTSTSDSPIRSLDTLAVSPDGLTLAVVGNIDSGSESDRLYTIPLAGGALTQVTSTNEVDHIPAFSPDGQTIYYANSVGGVNKVHRAPVSGGSGVVVNDTPANFGFRLSPDGQTIVTLTSVGNDDVLRAFPSAGGGSVLELSSPAVEGDSDRETFNFSDDGSIVVFATDARFRGANESSLFYVPATGGTAVEIPIAGSIPTTFDIDAVFYVGDKVYFKGDYDVNGENRIFTLPLTGGTPELLEITDFPSGADVDNFTISPDGKTIAFSADFDTVNIFELYVVPIEGGDAVKVSDPFTAQAIDLDITGDGVPDISDGLIDSDVLRDPLGVAIAWTPDSRNIVYLADGEVDEVYEPYLVENPLFQAVPGDYNSDGLVNAADYTVWRDTFGSTTDLRADGDESGEVDSADYTVWASGYGGPGASVAIPEPTGCLVMAHLLGWACARPRRS